MTEATPKKRRFHWFFIPIILVVILAGFALDSHLKQKRHDAAVKAIEALGGAHFPT